MKCKGCGFPCGNHHKTGRRRVWCSAGCRDEHTRKGKKAAPYVGHPATSDREYDEEEVVWLKAVDRWRRENAGRLPTACDLLGLAKSLGYRKG